MIKTISTAREETQEEKRVSPSPSCEGYHDYFGEFDCGYNTVIDCEECKYGGWGGRKDPEAKCNQ